MALGVEGLDLGAHGLQRGYDIQAGSVAHVVGIGFEGQAQDADGLAGQVLTDAGDHLAGHRLLARIVDLDGGLHQSDRAAGVSGGAHQGQGVLGKA